MGSPALHEQALHKRRKFRPGSASTKRRATAIRPALLLIVAAVFPAGLPSQTPPAPVQAEQPIYARATPAVVRVRGYNASNAVVFAATGFIVAGGRVMTTAHDLHAATRLDVLTAGGRLLLRTTHAEVVHPGLDVAILPRVASPPGILAMATAPPLVGEQVVVIGSTDATSNSASAGTVTGILSANGRR